jgi:Glu-tRNA(Gln) amidotransferase subunit E-like FAD-binding protein
LGIPLVEITTAPDLKTPEQIKEAALHIGEILRACKVKRGIGTIRQDLNISIEGSKRVEIKGFQDPKMMIETINREITRQLECVRTATCSEEVRNAKEDGSTEFLRPMPGSARMYPETDVLLLKISRDLVNEAKKTLPKLASEHKGYLQEFGLNAELVKEIMQEGKLEEFKQLTSSTSEYDLIAKSLTLFPKEFARKRGKTVEEIAAVLHVDVLEQVLSAVGKSISSTDVKTVLEKLLDGKTLKEALEKSSIDLDGEVKMLMKSKPGLSQGAYMGLIMAKFKGQVSGKEVSDALSKGMR